MNYLTPILITLLLLMPVIADAQQRGTQQQRGTTYESLLQRSDQPSSYITHVILPENDGSALTGVMFRLDYDLIPFLRVRSSDTSAPEDAEYFAPVHMGLEIFEGTHRTSRRSSSQDGQSIFRDSFQDTIYVQSFEETRSRLQHVEGIMSTRLQPGSYNYELQLRRAQSTREQSSTRRNISVPQYDTLGNAGLILLSEFQQDNNLVTGTFLNYGENVLYGSDYEVLVLLPDTEDEEYHFTLHQMESGTSSDVLSDAVFRDTLRAQELFRASDFELSGRSDGVRLTMTPNDTGTRFGSISVPNSGFANARFRLQVRTSDDEVIAQRIVNSRWLDMPVSLLNIDVAINMLRFIVSDSELRRLQSGSTAEKERKFREFWEERDPTPETEFNELMAEYYNRIDYAFRNFSSLQTPGYESDRGRAYILYGEPDNVERRLPTDQPTREIWEYPGRTLVFEATTGFGDFRLISER
ncbi:GWxTD domain-containing protein [Rhodohalobacter sp. SW132]|uniref:GWxTD domain-containing protein n=1 Tax=Rhodohalobacter sp. SW132 TaxID=2293433 RepID=UPI000E252E83|nr:GWxTD domain-containing protein [Rhodohalobacter sp. SW132]REL33644.1 GWxTD domain-containing protein [Rhodohalobacter sp. SW132]